MLRKKIPVLFLMLIASTGRAEPQYGLDHLLFPTVLDAVIAATNRYNPISISEDREFLGTVYKQNGEFGYTISSGRIGFGAVSIRFLRSELADVVAFWHTHGSAVDIHQYFSFEDTEVVNTLGIPMYLADHTGELKVYRPGDYILSKIASFNLGFKKGSRVARGTQVLHKSGELVRINTMNSFSILGSLINNNGASGSRENN